MTVIIADRADPAHPPEPEPIIVERQGDRTLLILEDGTTLACDAIELAACIAEGLQPHVQWKHAA